MYSNRAYPVILLLILFWFPKSHAVAAINASDDNSTLLNVGGNVAAMCKTRTKVKNRATNLDLSSATLQKTNHVYIWCNTGQDNAQTTYESVNGGYLINENGDLIPYMIQIPHTLDETNFTSARTVSQRTGSGTDGKDRMRTVKIRPLVTGFDYAGTYRDTIKVTVAIN